MVLFHPAKLVGNNHTGRRSHIKPILRVLDQQTREADVKGWWDRNTFAILLPDTVPEGAYRFLDKLFFALKEECHILNESIEKSGLKIYTYPNGKSIEPDDGNGPGEDCDRPNGNCGGFLDDLDVEDFTSLKGLNKTQAVIKRLLDIVISSFAIILLLPVLLLTALLIKLDSPGPIFYRQTRVCRGGKSFTLFKFRSMYQNADMELHRNHIRNLINKRAGLVSNGRGSEESYKLVEDKRVTRFGRFLRRTSIDELPQFFNVLNGDMSLVGPRPHPVYEVSLYHFWYIHRLDVKPGITCLGQIYGRCNTEYEDVYRLDLQYLKKASILLDLRILLKTIPIVLSCEGAS
jgi:lipopolysaccharide/colanic/teichoic acid biosynthesis glycosyltransferase